MGRKKRVLFIINTLGRAGAEFSLIQFIRQFDPEKYELHLYVMLGQGELVERIPDEVTLLNASYDPTDVLSENGKRTLYRHTMKQVVKRFAIFRNIPYIVENGVRMKGEGMHHPEKLLWKTIVDAMPPMKGHYDLAVAYLEGASTYYLSRKVNADKKIAFFHTDYVRFGYSRMLDQNTYDNIDKIYCVSEETRKSFLQANSKYVRKTEVFPNIIDRDAVILRASQHCSFDEDGFDGIRIVTLGRLIRLKRIDKSIRTMRRLKDRGLNVRWYVFGEGKERVLLEKAVELQHLQDCFFLPGAVDNPFPYLNKADIYVQCSEYEGRILAISEAQLLGRPVVISNHSGNVGQVDNWKDGVLVNFDPEEIANVIQYLIENPEIRENLGKNAEQKMSKECTNEQFEKIVRLLEG